MLPESISLAFSHVNIPFFVLMVLSSSVFLFVWALRVASLVHERKNSDRKNYKRVIVWTVIPAVIIIGLGILGPLLIPNLQHLS